MRARAGGRVADASLPQGRLGRDAVPTLPSAAKPRGVSGKRIAVWSGRETGYVVMRPRPYLDIEDSTWCCPYLGHGGFPALREQG